MAVINVIIGNDDDNVAFSEKLYRMQPGDRILLTAYGEYSSVSGEYLAVNNNGKCQGCIMDDLIDIVCTVYCGDCIIKKKEYILEGL